mmetsp:Transcript_30091/g.75971  ORF Transcript_30091/g.75971 Transcript_30091/m.75971 type:complete len:351 (-) Transcript_30091:271-1323(-)
MAPESLQLEGLRRDVWKFEGEVTRLAFASGRRKNQNVTIRERQHHPGRLVARVEDDVMNRGVPAGTWWRLDIDLRDRKRAEGVRTEEDNHLALAAEQASHASWILCDSHPTLESTVAEEHCNTPERVACGEVRFLATFDGQHGVQPRDLAAAQGLTRGQGEFACQVHGHVQALVPLFDLFLVRQSPLAEVDLGHIFSPSNHPEAVHTHGACTVSCDNEVALLARCCGQVRDGFASSVPEVDWPQQRRPTTLGVICREARTFVNKHQKSCGPGRLVVPSRLHPLQRHEGVKQHLNIRSQGAEVLEMPRGIRRDRPMSCVERDLANQRTALLEVLPLCRRHVNPLAAQESSP